MIALIDNYDSFTYNLFQYLGELGAEVRVWRNDAIGAEALLSQNPRAIVISPGPGRPDSAGITKDVLSAADNIPVLGVCLGHQALGETFGAKVVAARHLMHGKTSPIKHDGKTIFDNLPSPMTVMRYHSLALAEDSIPAVFEISARGGGEVMAMRHKTLPRESVQFHPESIMTPEGKPLLQNFLRHYLGA
ncbi:MAG: anthranilate synthase component II [Gammaproteobacteria bacterium]